MIMGKAVIVDDSAEDDGKIVLELLSGANVLIEASGDKTEAFLISEASPDAEVVCKVGSFDFELFEEGCDYMLSSGYKVTNMFLEGCGGKYLRQGIGTAIVEFQEQMYGPVIFGEDTGTTAEDGSHLTGDGKPFAAAMLKRKNRG
ncbi:hypothetical protein [Halomonas sp. ND22Bw]|uniref:hypothetical protein n=1 Tax=Halomonas sp. ND22Bw TaxID=2054178 RepID=UPI0015E7BA5A